RSAAVRLLRLRIVFKPAKAEISKQRFADRLGEPRGQAVVVSNRTARKTKQTRSWTAESTQHPLAREFKVVQAEAPEHADTGPGREVNAGIETILAKRTGTGSQEIIEYARSAWRRK